MQVMRFVIDAKQTTLTHIYVYYVLLACEGFQDDKKFPKWRIFSKFLYLFLLSIIWL